jgi:hypothetical protein
MKDLQSYFNQAKKQEVLISREKINDMIIDIDRQRQSSTQTFDFPPILKTRQFIYVSLTFSIMLIAAILSVVMIQTTPTAEQVYVPESQQRLLQLVNALNQIEQSNSVKVLPFRETGALAKKVVEAKNVVPIHLRSKFELSESKLAQIGITFRPNEIIYEGNVKGHGYITFSISVNGSRAVSLSENQHDGVKIYESYPWFLSDETGYQGVRYRFDNEPELKMTNEFFENTLDQLIPIQINRPGFTKVIFWYQQTDELMKVLESSANILPEQGQQRKEQVSTIKLELYPTE